jgi:hypothetical protein
MTAATKQINGSYKISVPDNETITLDTGANGKVSITGDLEVLGTETIVNSTVTTITDNIITYNAGDDVGSTVTLGTAGIEIHRGSGTKATVLFSETGGAGSTPTWLVDKGDGTAREVLTSTVLGSTALFNISEDTTSPALGANLNVSGFNLFGSINTDVELSVSGSGEILMSGPVHLASAVSSTQAAGVSLGTAADTGGGTEVHYRNTTSTGELISKTKAIAFAMIL